jgi:hypothetical protein
VSAKSFLVFMAVLAIVGLLERGAETLGVADRIWAPDFRDRMLVIATALPSPGGAQRS